MGTEPTDCLRTAFGLWSNFEVLTEISWTASRKCHLCHQIYEDIRGWTIWKGTRFTDLYCWLTRTKRRKVNE